VKCLLLALLIGGIALKAGAQNMVVYDDALESGWQNYGWATLNYTNSTPVQSGTASISVVDPGSSYGALYLGHTAFNPSPYQSLSFWVFPTVSGSNELAAQATLNGSAQPAVPLSFTPAQVGNWQLITIPLASLGVAANPAFTGFWIQNITGAPLTFYVDTISLVAVPPPNPVALSVSPQTIIRTIDSRMYGVNLAMWDSNLIGAPTAAFLATMGTGAVRFPGGSGSDDYDWQTDRGVSNASFQWANNAATFASVTQAQGAQPFVTVNYGSGTPQEAAAWVAYYNGAASSTASLGVDAKGRNWNTVGYWASIRGAAPLATDDGYNFLRASHPAPFGFQYWEIGNECYGSWENDLHGVSGSGLTGVAHDPYTYAVAFQSYSSQMLAVDPAIHIGAVATPGEDSYSDGTHGVANPNEGNSIHTGWTPVVIATLKSLGVTPQFLIHHSYAQNPGNENDAVLLQAGSSLQSDAANLRSMITNYAGTSGSSIELDVTELNSVSSNPGKQSTSLVNGLFMVDAIGNLANTEFNACTWWDLRNGGLTNDNNSSLLYGWREYGDYGVVSSGDVSGTPANTPYPSFYAAKLLTHWGRGGDSVVSTTSAYSLLSIYGAKLGNGSLALLVVNKHPTADLNARITLNNFTTGSTAAPIYSYGKPNDLAGADITSGTATLSGTAFTYTFPSYSMSVLVVKSQFENWREQNFTAAQLSAWSVSGDTGDPAQDGMPNLTKYALGLNPNAPASSGLPAIGQVSLNGKTYLTLTFTDQAALTDIAYTVQVSTDLQNWKSGSLYTVRTDNGSTGTAVFRDLTAIEDAPRQFMRLSVTRQ
jgi:alpha-N-arabinofuranosidase